MVYNTISTVEQTYISKNIVDVDGSQSGYDHAFISLRLLLLLLVSATSTKSIPPISPYPWLTPSPVENGSANRFCHDNCCVFRDIAVRLTLFIRAVRFPSSRIALMLWPSCPSRETRWTSLLWAMASAVKALCSSGVRRERCERRALMLRRMGWERVAVELGVSADMLAT